MAELVVTVSQLNEYIGRKISSDAMLKGLKVRGEITNFKVNSSGSAFFTLKDADASINCVMFDYTEEGIEDGKNVTVGANMNVWQKDGRLSLVVYSIENTGLGDLYLRLEEVKKRLYDEGLFDPAHKKKLPVLPKAVGVVTSVSGAAMHDIIQIAKRRCPGIKLYIYPAKVQGEGAAEEIIAGIAYFNREMNVDVIIVGRGGGSFEDLFAFNEERVARAVYASRLPVVSAVGHEVDYTLTDLAADLRAPTPSAAAELAVPDKESLRANLQNLKEKCEAGAYTAINTAKTALFALKSAVAAGSPERRLKDLKNALQGTERLLAANMNNILREKQSAVMEYKTLLTALNPYDTLKRGYAIVKNAGGRAVSNVRGLTAGEGVEILFHDGMAAAKVERITRNGKGA